MRIMADVEKVANAARMLVPQQLARVVDATVASTKKSEGVKKAKRSRAELGRKEEEEKREEDVMTTWLDRFTNRKELAKIVLAAADRRSRSDQDTANDAIMDMDLTRMSDERTQYYLDRQELARQDVKRELKKRVAEEEAEVAASVAAQVAAAAAFVAIALAAVVTPVTAVTAAAPVSPVSPVSPAAPAAPIEEGAMVVVSPEGVQLSDAHQVISCSEVENLFEKFTSGAVESEGEELPF